ncbi:rCG55174 [Rattus norvegicus]|uniref:RCG55174 n=1 Tax=Rattus norvegicus TaxID=10116 RepID=A6J833_RAT|nr:rCG55174 [Rattus norvegicus]
MLRPLLEGSQAVQNLISQRRKRDHTKEQRNCVQCGFRTLNPFYLQSTVCFLGWGF